MPSNLSECVVLTFYFGLHLFISMKNSNILYSKKLWWSKSLAKRATARHWWKKLWRKSMCRFRAIN